MTKRNVHELTGLGPDTLATYLAALGIARPLPEEKGAHARGFWRDQHSSSSPGPKGPLRLGGGCHSGLGVPDAE
ncbi:MAG: hypothetical protein H0X67_03435 [Acidobacteria bacterium]|nr:hypothetical protein [Acidobacteriota bacterium]